MISLSRLLHPNFAIDVTWQRLFLPIMMMVTALGCGSRDLSVPEQEAFPAHFAAIRDRILVPRCVNCHAKLVSYEIVMEEMVRPGHPDESELYTIVASKRMPEYGSKLEDVELAAIRSWIANGALND